MTELTPIPLPSTGQTGADEITFIGTATAIIKVAGFSILTDPNFLHQGDRAYVGMGLSTKRLTEPADRQVFRRGEVTVERGAVDPGHATTNGHRSSRCLSGS